MIFVYDLSLKALNWNLTGLTIIKKWTLESKMRAIVPGGINIMPMLLAVQD